MAARRPIFRTLVLVSGMLGLLTYGCLPVAAQKRYAPGISDSEIKIGQTMPYSGPASAYRAIGMAERAYLAMINDRGGVNGRKINLISVDDGYSPPKTFEQTRKLVEQDEVAFIFSSLGTPTGIVVRKYLNERKIPQLFQASGATFWGDPEHFPWSIGWQPNYQTEGAIYGRYLLTQRPGAKVGVLYQNDDAGRDYFAGFRAGLGTDASQRMIGAIATYQTSDPTLDSQIVTLQVSGADVLFNNTTPKFAAQAIRKVYDLGWKPLHFLTSVATSVTAVLEPAGFEKSQGLITAAYLKDPNDPQWVNDPAYKDWLAFMQKYYPDGNLGDSFNVYGYSVAQTLVELLGQCGDALTRENIMQQAAHLNLDLPMLLPGIRVHTSPADFFPLKQMHLQRFEGRQWVLFGAVIGG